MAEIANVLTADERRAWIDGRVAGLKHAHVGSDTGRKPELEIMFWDGYRAGLRERALRSV